MEYSDMVHGFVLFGGVVDAAHTAVADCCAYLRRAFENRSGGMREKMGA